MIRLMNPQDTKDTVWGLAAGPYSITICPFWPVFGHLEHQVTGFAKFYPPSLYRDFNFTKVNLL